MRLPTNHPGKELLLDYADGSLREPFALVVATHLAMCPECRAWVAEMEALGGALLEEIEPEPLSDACLQTVMANLQDECRSEARRDAPEEIRIPQPLRSYLPGPLSHLPWRSVVSGLDEFLLPIGAPQARTRLMRIRANTAMPRHTHEGSELTLVLQGGFRDEMGHYLPGDAVLSGPELDHRPVADDDGDCICLAVNEAPVRLTGMFSRFLNPFVRF